MVHYIMPYTTAWTTSGLPPWTYLRIAETPSATRHPRPCVVLCLQLVVVSLYPNCIEAQRQHVSQRVVFSYHGPSIGVLSHLVLSLHLVYSSQSCASVPQHPQQDEEIQQHYSPMTWSDLQECSFVLGLQECFLICINKLPESFSL